MRVVYYARVSTEEEKQKNALENQINMLEEYINVTEGWTLVDKYIDAGVSGTTTKKRLRYNRLFEDLLEDKFEIIVIKDHSRLCRNVLDWHMFIDRVIKQGKKLFFFNERQFYKPEDQLITGIKALVAAEFSRDLSNKVKSGQARRQENGVIFGNGSIWGYNQKDGKLTINEDEAIVIRLIFDMYINNYGFRTIFKSLAEKGYKNRNGKPFAMTTLNRIIKNEKYKGVLISNKKSKDFASKKINDVPEREWIRHDDIIPEIVSKEIWEKANEILRTKKRKNNISDKETIAGYFSGTHLYSGKIKCGECGSTFWHVIYRKNNLWMCKEYKAFGLKKEGKAHGCIGTKISSKALDKILQEIVYKVWQNQEESIAKVISILDKVLEESGYNDSIKKLEKDKIKYKNKLENLIDMRADGEITKEQFMLKKKEVEDCLNSVEVQMEEYNLKNEKIVSKKERILEIKNLSNKKLLNSNELNEDIIAHFLNKIIVKSENELEIILNDDFEYLVCRPNKKQDYQCVTTTR